MSELREQLREGIARIIYEQAFEPPSMFPKPAWVPRGNSDKQDEARDIAKAVLSLTAVVEVVEALRDLREATPGTATMKAARVKADAVLARVGVLRTGVGEDSSSCAERAAITTCPDSPSQAGAGE